MEILPLEESCEEWNVLETALGKVFEGELREAAVLSKKICTRWEGFLCEMDDGHSTQHTAQGIDQREKEV